MPVVLCNPANAIGDQRDLYRKFPLANGEKIGDVPREKFPSMLHLMTPGSKDDFHVCCYSYGGTDKVWIEGQSGHIGADELNYVNSKHPGLFTLAGVGGDDGVSVLLDQNKQEKEARGRAENEVEQLRVQSRGLASTLDNEQRRNAAQAAEIEQLKRDLAAAKAMAPAPVEKKKA